MLTFKQATTQAVPETVIVMGPTMYLSFLYKVAAIELWDRVAFVEAQIITPDVAMMFMENVIRENSVQFIIGLFNLARTKHVHQNFKKLKQIRIKHANAKRANADHTIVTYKFACWQWVPENIIA